MENLQQTSSPRKGSPKTQMELGGKPLQVLWIDCKVESINKMEHHMQRHRRVRLQKEAVRRAVAGLQPPEVRDENEDTPCSSP